MFCIDINSEDRLVQATFDPGACSVGEPFLYIGFEEGDHLWVGHDEEVRAEIAKLLVAAGKPGH